MQILCTKQYKTLLKEKKKQLRDKNKGTYCVHGLEDSIF